MNRTVALIYVRVSRLDEEERARKISPEMQSDRALALRELAGLAVESFEDLDISGKSATNRPGYQRLLERLRAGGVRYVVAYDLSRITRSMGDQADFFTELDRAGALFLEASTGRTSDPRDENDELSANVVGSVNQHYRRALARKVRDALGAKVDRGEIVGPPPAGYVRNREILPNGKIARTWVEPDPERAPIIRTVFAEYATGTWSYLSLARSLEARGTPLPRHPDKKVGAGARPTTDAAAFWTADVVKDLIRNPRYMGRIPRKDGSLVVGKYVALIDETTWRECERVRLRQASSQLRLAPRVGTRYLLSGLLRCPSCGSTMAGQTFTPDGAGSRPTRGAHRGGTHAAARYTYRCHRKRTARTCDSRLVPQEWVETQLLDVLRDVALPEGFADAFSEDVGHAIREADQTPRCASAKSIEAQLQRLTRLFELGDIVESDYVARRDALRVRLDEARVTKPVIPLARQRQQLGSIVEDWEHMPIEDRRRLVAFVFEQLVADIDDGTLRLLPTEPWQRYMRAAVGPDGRELRVRCPTSGPSPVFRSEVVTGIRASCSCRCRARTAST